MGSTLLSEQRFDAAGNYEFCADVPAEALSGEPVRIELTLGKSFVPEADGRELGVVAERATLVGCSIHAIDSDSGAWCDDGAGVLATARRGESFRIGARELSPPAGAQEKR